MRVPGRPPAPTRPARDEGDMPHRFLAAEMLSEVAGQLPAFIVVFGRNREVLWANRFAHGYQMDGVIGSRTEGDVHPEDRPRWVHCLQTCLDLGETATGTVRLLASGVTLAWRMGPLRNSGNPGTGGVVGVLVVSWDITHTPAADAAGVWVPLRFALSPTCRQVVDLLRDRGEPVPAKAIALAVGETTGACLEPSTRLRGLLNDLEARGVLRREAGGYSISPDFLPYA